MIYALSTLIPTPFEQHRHKALRARGLQLTQARHKVECHQLPLRRVQSAFLIFLTLITQLLLGN